MTKNPPNILLFGAGSVGAIYLHQLQRAGCTVTAVCRSNYAVVQERGFTLLSQRFGNVTYKPDHTVRSMAECPADAIYDYILVTTKSFPGSRPSLPEILSPMVASRPNTVIVLAQNGIGIEEEVHTAFPTNPLLSGVIYLPTRQTSPGTIEHPEMLNLLELGTYPAQAPESHVEAAAAFASLMTRGGGEAKVVADIQAARWEKLVMNAAWNPICALSLCTDGDFLTSSEFAEELVWGVMMEIVALARAKGVAGVDETAARAKLAIAQRRAESRTGREVSMLQDVKNGRRFEVEAILGNAVRIGRQCGLLLPRLETLYALAKGRYDALSSTIPN